MELLLSDVANAISQSSHADYVAVKTLAGLKGNGRTAEELAARLVGPDVVITGISTDSRTLQAGELFVALRGPNHDGHQHVDAALRRGAAALLVEHAHENSGADTAAADITQLVVSDSLLALGVIGALLCNRTEALKIAVTGSNGKTTVKEMLANMLSACCDTDNAVLATLGNFNNDIGLPLTTARLQAQHRFAVFEIGTSGKGEIAYLTTLAQPDIALVNNVAAAHLEGFGSIENIAIEKSSIFSGLSRDGYALFDADSEHHQVMRKAASHCKTRTFGMSDNADVRGVWQGQQFSVCFADKTEMGDLAGKEVVPKLNLVGKHNYANALSAIAAASCTGLPMESLLAGLSAMQSVSGRLQVRQTNCDATIIDDTYNANPASVKAAIDLLSEYSGKRTLILGDMLELGADELNLHAEMGRYARESGVDSLLTVGSLAAHAASEFGAHAASFSEKEELAECLRGRLGDEHTLLFKGSRGARMEEVIELLLSAPRQLAGAGNGGSIRQQRVAIL